MTKEEAIKKLHNQEESHKKLLSNLPKDLHNIGSENDDKVTYSFNMIQYLEACVDVPYIREGWTFSDYLAA